MLFTDLLAHQLPYKSTLPGIFIGVFLGVLLATLFGWGLAAILGRKFLFSLGWAIAAAFIGLLGAVIGDAKTATKRGLDDREIAVSKRIFGETIDYSRVKLRLGTRLMNWPKRRMSRTPGNTIYFSKTYSNPSPTDTMTYAAYEDLLVHEMTHIWQTQHGIGLGKKLKAALRVMFNRKKPYDYGGFTGLFKASTRNKHFRDFNTEQQGKILEHYHCCAFHQQYRKEESTSNNCILWRHFLRQVQYNNGYHIERDTFPD